MKDNCNFTDSAAECLSLSSTEALLDFVRSQLNCLLILQGTAQLLKWMRGDDVQENVCNSYKKWYWQGICRELPK